MDLKFSPTSVKIKIYRKKGPIMCIRYVSLGTFKELKNNF